MKRYCLVLLAISLFCGEALSGLECYSCSSKKSLEDCEKNQARTLGCKSLNSSSFSCYIFHSVSSEGHVSIGKNCINADLCHKENACHREFKECKMFCCSEAGCNQFSSSINFHQSNYLFVCLLSFLIGCYLTS